MTVLFITWCVDNMGAPAKKFRNKYDGFKMRVMVWVCESCDLWHYRKRPTECNLCGKKGFYYFASTAEAKRYAELLIQLRAKLIRNLQVQVNFPLQVNGVLIYTYRADFVYYKNDVMVVEDVKADIKSDKALTDIFKAKKKHMGAQYGIDVQIVKRS